MCMTFQASVRLHLFSFQQPPVGGNLHLQVLLDAKQLLVVRLVALHVQAQLGQLVLQLGQRCLETLHLQGILESSLSQVSFQHTHLLSEHTGEWSTIIVLLREKCGKAENCHY